MLHLWNPHIANLTISHAVGFCTTPQVSDIKALQLRMHAGLLGPRPWC